MLPQCHLGHSPIMLTYAAVKNRSNITVYFQVVVSMEHVFCIYNTVSLVSLHMRHFKSSFVSSICEWNCLRSNLFLERLLLKLLQLFLIRTLLSI